MGQIRKFNEKINDLENINSIDEKEEHIKTIKSEIKDEQIKTEEMINKIKDLRPKKYKKFKGYSLEKLQELFDSEEDLNERIKIYQNIIYLIESFKQNLFSS